MLPRIELVRRGECVTLCLNLWLPEQTCSDAFEAELQAAAAALDALLLEAPLPPQIRHSWQREDCPSQPQWQTLVEQVTAPDFQAHTPRWCCRARAGSPMTVRRSQPTRRPSPLVAAGQLGTARSGLLSLRLPVFARAELYRLLPERLYRREHQHLFTEALAGTIRRSGDEATDAALAAELLADSKNRLENRLVHADILSRLAPLTTDATLTEPRILKLRLLQHLKCDIEAELKPGVCDWQLLEALHPTLRWAVPRARRRWPSSANASPMTAAGMPAPAAC